MSSEAVDPLLIQQACDWHERATVEAGPLDGANASADSSRAKERAEWKRRQAIQPSVGTLLAPTLPERINRLNPSERHQLSTMIRSLKLRKIVKRTLAEAFWLGEQRKAALALAEDPEFFAHSMKRLRAIEQGRVSSMSYERALTSFEPVVTQSQQPTLIEVPR